MAFFTLRSCFPPLPSYFLWSAYSSKNRDHIFKFQLKICLLSFLCLTIQEAMRKAEAAGNKDCPVKIKLVAPPSYVLNTQTLDKVTNNPRKKTSLCQLNWGLYWHLCLNGVLHRLKCCLLASYATLISLYRGSLSGNFLFRSLCLLCHARLGNIDFYKVWESMTVLTSFFFFLV